MLRLTPTAAAAVVTTAMAQAMAQAMAMKPLRMRSIRVGGVMQMWAPIAAVAGSSAPISWRMRQLPRSFLTSIGHWRILEQVSMLKCQLEILPLHQVMNLLLFYHNNPLNLQLASLWSHQPWNLLTHPWSHPRLTCQLMEQITLKHHQRLTVGLTLLMIHRETHS